MHRLGWPRVRLTPSINVLMRRSFGIHTLPYRLMAWTHHHGHHAMCLRRRILAISLLMAFALDPAQAQYERESVSGLAPMSPERFGQFGDNYVISNTMRNNGWSQKDESALRAHYSLKFTICGPQFSRRDRSLPTPAAASSSTADPPSERIVLCPEGQKLRMLELFAAYIGEFDFYWGTRDSGPVINRISNPGLFVRAPFHMWIPDYVGGTGGIEIGIEHRSDGQVTEVTSARDIERARAAYAAGDRYYFDTISRGANFVSMTAYHYGIEHLPGLELRAKARLYLNQDSAVTWGPLADSGRRFSDYDRLQMQFAYKSKNWGRYEVEWRVGDMGLATDSMTLGWQAPSRSFPIYVRIHHGPMNTLSNYTQRQDSIGVGLRFSNF